MSRDWQWCKIDVTDRLFCLEDENNDSDEYMNAAAAHAAFVMTVSAARMYWLLRHAQHTHNINIHKLHPLRKKIGLGCADFMHSGTGYVEIAEFILLLIFCWFQSQFFRTSTACSEKFNHDYDIVEPVALKQPWLFHADFNQYFLHSGTPLL